MTITDLEVEVEAGPPVAPGTYEQIELTKTKRNADSFIENNTARKLIKAADKAFENMWYSEASDYYEEAFAYIKNVPAMQTLQKAADSYYFIGDMGKSLKMVSSPLR